MRDERKSDDPRQGGVGSLMWSASLAAGLRRSSSPGVSPFTRMGHFRETESGWGRGEADRAPYRARGAELGQRSYSHVTKTGFVSLGLRQAILLGPSHVSRDPRSLFPLTDVTMCHGSTDPRRPAGWVSQDASSSISMVSREPRERRYGTPRTISLAQEQGTGLSTRCPAASPAARGWKAEGATPCPLREPIWPHVPGV